MNINKQYLFCILSFLLFASVDSLYAQKLFYDIYKGEDRIGEIIIDKIEVDNKVHYEANSEANFRVLFKNRLLTHNSANFVDNELVYAKSEIILNDNVRNHNITKREGEHYSFFKHPDDKIKRKQAPFVNCTVALYYEEPTGLTGVFSENHQQVCALKSIGDHAYEMELPGGKINQYFYKNGKLVEIKVIRTFVDLSFRLKETG